MMSSLFAIICSIEKKGWDDAIWIHIYDTWWSQVSPRYVQMWSYFIWKKLLSWGDDHLFCEWMVYLRRVIIHAVFCGYTLSFLFYIYIYIFFEACYMHIYGTSFFKSINQQIRLNGWFEKKKKIVRRRTEDIHKNCNFVLFFGKVSRRSPSMIMHN